MAKIGIEKFIQKALGIRPKRSTFSTGKKFNAFVYAENYAYIMADRRRAQLQEYKLKTYGESLYRLNRKRIAYSEDAKESFGKKILETGKKTAVNVWQFIKRLAQAFVNMFKQLIIKLTDKTEKLKETIKASFASIKKYKEKDGFKLTYKAVLKKDTTKTKGKQPKTDPNAKVDLIQNSIELEKFMTTSASLDSLRIHVLSGRAENNTRLNQFLEVISKLKSGDLENANERINTVTDAISSKADSYTVISSKEFDNTYEEVTLKYNQTTINEYLEESTKNSKAINNIKTLILNMSQIKNASVSTTEKFDNEQLVSIRENIALLTTFLNSYVKMLQVTIDGKLKILSTTVEAYSNSASAAAEKK